MKTHLACVRYGARVYTLCGQRVAEGLPTTVEEEEAATCLLCLRLSRRKRELDALGKRLTAEVEP